MAGSVCGETHRFTDHRQASTATARSECVLEGQLGLIIDKPARHHEVLGYPESAPLLKVTDFCTRDLVELAAGDILIDLR
ncbi:hypothetical protein [Arthrobacter sp. D2-10]